MSLLSSLEDGAPTMYKELEKYKDTESAAQK